MSAPAEDFDRYIPADLQDNYRRLVAEQYGGDWNALGRELAQHPGSDRLTQWAHAQADAAGQREVAAPPAGRRAPAGRQQTAG